MGLHLAIRQRVRVVQLLNFLTVDTPQLHRNFQNSLIDLILYGRASVHHHE